MQGGADHTLQRRQGNQLLASQVRALQRPWKFTTRVRAAASVEVGHPGKGLGKRGRLETAAIHALVYSENVTDEKYSVTGPVLSVQGDF